MLNRLKSRIRPSLLFDQFMQYARCADGKRWFDQIDAGSEFPSGYGARPSLHSFCGQACSMPAGGRRKPLSGLGFPDIAANTGTSPTGCVGMRAGRRPAKPGRQTQGSRRAAPAPSNRSARQALPTHPGRSARVLEDLWPSKAQGDGIQDGLGLGERTDWLGPRTAAPPGGRCRGRESDAPGPYPIRRRFWKRLESH